MRADTVVERTSGAWARVFADNVTPALIKTARALGLEVVEGETVVEVTRPPDSNDYRLALILVVRPRGYK